jgi:hypothetical protein
LNERRNAADKPDTIPLSQETLRNSAYTNEVAAKAEGIGTFWKVFGGTLLSIAALAIITLCQHFNGRLNALQADSNYQDNDLRKDLGRLCEAQGELLKKGEFDTRLKSIWDGMKELRDSTAIVTALKERAALTEQQLKIAEEERKELMREVHLLREQRAADQERRELLREVQSLRERLAAMEVRKQERAVKPADGTDE